MITDKKLSLVKGDNIQQNEFKINGRADQRTGLLPTWKKDLIGHKCKGEGRNRALEHESDRISGACNQAKETCLD